MIFSHVVLAYQRSANEVRNANDYHRDELVEENICRE